MAYFKNVVPTLILGLMLVSSCTHSPVSTTTESSTASAEKIQIAYQTGRQGTLDPCGCASSPNGGLDRELNLLTDLRKKGPVIYVDSGDLYAPLKPGKGMSQTQYRERANAITDILNDLQLDVFSPGPQDMKLGLDFLKKQKELSKFRWVATNLVDASGQPVFNQMEIVEKAGTKFAFLAISPVTKDIPKEMKLLDPKTTLETWVEKASQQADYVVVLSQLKNTQKDQAMFTSLPKVQLWIGNDPSVSRVEGVPVNTTQLLLDPHSFGYMTGVLELEAKKPFKAWFSPATLRRNQEAIASFERIKPSLEGKQLENMQKRVEKIKKNEVWEEIPGATSYSHQLVPLDPTTYGTPNAITEKIKKEKKRVALKAIE